MLTHLSLFSGIGGIDLAAEWAGFQTVAFCEKNKFCQQILNKHWSNVPIIEDIHDVPTSELLGQHRTGGLTLISGGFPCQPFSTAGKRRGKEDDRYLWPAMLESIKTYRPTWVVGENVAGLTYDLAFDTVLSDLEENGYESQPFIIPACGVGAYHRRDRVFIVAHSTSSIPSTEQERQCETMGRSQYTLGNGETEQSVTMAHSNEQPTKMETPDPGGQSRESSELFQRKMVFKGIGQAITKGVGASRILRNPTIEGLPDWAGGEMGQPQPLTEFERPSGREIERDFRGMAHGVSRRVDRLRALGNAVVPQQVYPILKAIADIENKFGE